jgi:hypothetical protein
MNFIWGIALLIISYTITALTAKKPVDAKPASFSDFQFPQYQEGTPQPVIFGDVWTSDWVVLYTGQLKTQAIRQKSGGKK